jgi:hypothetical protein
MEKIIKFTAIFVVFCAVAVTNMSARSSQQPDVPIVLHVPKTLVQGTRFECLVATDYADKVECVKNGLLFVGSFRNPRYKNATNISMDLLNNQKYAFLFTQPNGTATEKKVVEVTVPHKQLSTMVVAKKARFAIPK